MHGRSDDPRVRRMRRGRVAVLALTLVTAACRAPEAEDGGRPPPATRGTTPGRSPEPSPAVPTRPAGASSAVAVTVSPFAVAGWWDGTRWMVADGSVPVPVSGGETYTILHADGTTATSRGSAVMPGCETNPGTSTVEVPGLRSDARRPSLAVSGVPVPRPRPTTALGRASPVYRQAAASLLRERGIDDPGADVVQVLRADLDGDGKDEVVVVAERIASPDLFAREGDYSLVFVRRLVDERPVPSVVVESIPRTGPGETPFIVSHRVTAIVDLNGDGRMEVAVAWRYYEGAGVEVHELQPDGSLPVVMEGGCGA